MSEDRIQARRDLAESIIRGVERDLWNPTPAMKRAVADIMRDYLAGTTSRDVENIGANAWDERERRTSERDAATHERDLLGETLGDLLVALGDVNAVSMTGPQLVQAAQNVMLRLNKTRPARFWPHAPRSESQPPEDALQ